jgi:hypothetical protein
VVPGDGGDADGDQMTSASSSVWSASTIVSWRSSEV